MFHEAHVFLFANIAYAFALCNPPLPTLGAHVGLAGAAARRYQGREPLGAAFVPASHCAGAPRQFCKPRHARLPLQHNAPCSGGGERRQQGGSRQRFGLRCSHEHRFRRRSERGAGGVSSSGSGSGSGRRAVPAILVDDVSGRGIFGGKARLRLATQKSRPHAPPAPMRSTPAYFLCKRGV
jgi:hypothetical protein